MRELPAVVFALLLLVPGPARADELEEAMAVLDRLEQTPVEVDYADRPLEEIVEDLAARSGLPVRGDWPALWRLGVRPTDRVDYRLARGPAARAISGLMLVLGDEFSRPVWEVHAGQVVLTTESATAPMRLTAAYDVRDLVTDAALVQRLREQRPPLDVPPIEADPDGTAALPGQATAGDAPPTPAQAPPPGIELVALIMDHVDPEAWLEYGGVRGHISERAGMLLVSAAPTTHRRLQRALASLRELRPRGLNVDATLVLVPAEAFAVAMRGRTLQSRAAAMDLVGDERAEVRWRSAASVAFGSEAVLGAEAGDAEVQLRLAPTLEPDAGRVLLTVSAAMLAETVRRSVDTTVSLPVRGGAAIVELPPPAGDGQADARLVLVLLPRS